MIPNPIIPSEPMRNAVTKTSEREAKGDDLATFLLWVAESYEAHALCADFPDEIEGYLGSAKMAREHLAKLSAPEPQPEVAAEDWRDDPSSDERWNEGVNFAITQLCAIFGIEPKSISWDAATETVDGDVSSVLCNVLVAAYGEEWSSNERDTAAIRALLDGPAPEQTGVAVPDGWHLVPETPTEGQMNAGLYQSSHDATYADVRQSYIDMVRTPTDAPPLFATPSVVEKAVKAENPRPLVDELTGALRFIMAFYDPGQTYLDTNAWKVAEAGGRSALAKGEAFLTEQAAAAEADAIRARSATP